jgi:hypothetical protein
MAAAYQGAIEAVLAVDRDAARLVDTAPRNFSRLHVVGSSRFCCLCPALPTAASGRGPGDGPKPGVEVIAASPSIRGSLELGPPEPRRLVGRHAGVSSSLALGAALEAVNFRALRVSASRLLSGEVRARAYGRCSSPCVPRCSRQHGLALAAAHRPARSASRQKPPRSSARGPRARPSSHGAGASARGRADLTACGAR